MTDCSWRYTLKTEIERRLLGRQCFIGFESILNARALATTTWPGFAPVFGALVLNGFGPMPAAGSLRQALSIMILTFLPKMEQHVI